MRRLKYGGLLCGVVFLLGISVIKLEWKTLKTRAQLILYVTCTLVETKDAFTHYSFQIKKQYKGSEAKLKKYKSSDGTIYLKQVTKLIQSTTNSNSNSFPSISKDNDYILFLTRPNKKGYAATVGFHQGIFSVLEEGSVKKVYDHYAKEIITLEEFESKLQ